MRKPTGLLRPTISKSGGADKAAARLFLLLTAWLTMLTGVGAQPALALPATIAWEVPLAANETYFLEVADTPGFAKALLTTEVRGTGYLWQAPAEGVYHWRLTRPGQKSQAEEGVEISYLASGSFALLDPTLKREHPPRLSWDAAPGADRYKIYVLDADNKQRIMTVTDTFLIVPKVETAMMLEMVPFTDEHRSSRTYHLDPSLKLNSGVAAVPAAVAAVPPPPKPLIVKETLLIGDQTDHNRRRHAAYLYAAGMQETLHFQKLSIDLTSTTVQPAGGAGLWLNPVYGLVISGMGDYHEHTDPQVKQAAVFPNQNITVDQSRFTADLSIGYNILDFFGVERWIFVLSGSGAITQLPLLPRGYRATPGSPVPLEKERLSLFGGSGSFGYLGSSFSVLTEAGGLLENTIDGRYIFGRLLLEFYPAERLAIQLGAFGREQQATTCAADAASCLFYGHSQTTADEVGVLLGIGSVLR